MGLSNANVAFAIMAMRNAARSPSVLTVGKQTFWPDRHTLAGLLQTAQMPLSEEEVFALAGRDGDGSCFLRSLGASSVSEIDASNYEGASVVHDLNCPVPSQLHDACDFLYDGGSLEHIFNVPEVFRNYGRMLRHGGVLAVSTSANNLCGHGFYQFSPELIFRYFRSQNGWAGTKVFLCHHLALPPTFWSVTDPMTLGHRIQVRSKHELYLLFVTRKVGECDSTFTPQQSDYTALWNRVDRRDNSHVAGSASHKAQSWTDSVIHRFRTARPIRRLWPLTPVKDLDQPGIEPLTLRQFLDTKLEEAPV